MKISYLSTFYPYRGGIAQFNALLLKAFQAGHDARAFTFKRQYPDILFPGKSQYVSESDSAVKIEAERILDSINPLSYYSAASKIKKFRPDLMVTKFWMPFFGPSLGTVAKSLRKNGTINISILDNVEPHEKRFLDNSFINYFLRQNHGFIVMSSQVEKDLLKYIPDAKYKLLSHPLYAHFGEKIDKTKAREQLNLPKDKKILLFFGFIREYKGLDLMLETLKYLSDEYLLVVAGETYGSFAKYEEIIKNNNLADKTRLFVRYIDDNEVPLFFSAADVCMLPYKSATQSGITGITFHFGLPVIATDVGGLRESVEPFGLGTVVAEPLENMLFAAIEDYFNFNLEDKFSANIEQFKRRASWENFANGIIDLYNEIK